jgi:hypothetical protein
MKRATLALIGLAALADQAAGPELAAGQPTQRAPASSGGLHRIHRLRLPAQAGPPPAPASPAPLRLYLPPLAAPSGPPGPGWFKTQNQLGWGAGQNGGQTVLGIYQRPARPDIPAHQTQPIEGEGAAGVSWTLKLGH